MQKRIGLSLILLAMALCTSYAFAQKKEASKPATPAAAPPSAAAPASGSCEACAWGNKQGMKGGLHECPMVELVGTGIVQVKVEKTAQGAVIRLDAAKLADAPKVQELAQKIAHHIEAGCDMQGEMKKGGKGAMMGGAMMHEHGRRPTGHQHGHPPRAQLHAH